MLRLECDPSQTKTICAEPHFVVGQDNRGFWLVIETHNMAGGLFRSREHALHFVDFETGRRPGAVEVSTEPLTIRF